MRSPHKGAGGCSAVAAAQGGRAALEITGEAADATEAQVCAKWFGFPPPPSLKTGEMLARRAADSKMLMFLSSVA